MTCAIAGLSGVETRNPNFFNFILLFNGKIDGGCSKTVKKTALSLEISERRDSSTIKSKPTNFRLTSIKIHLHGARNL